MFMIQEYFPRKYMDAAEYPYGICAMFKAPVG